MGSGGPCLFVSASCDCDGCREHRRRGLEAAAVKEARARDFRRWDEEEGRLPPPPPPPPPLPLSPDTTPWPKRRRGDRTWAALWEELRERQRGHQEELLELRTLARKLGFRFRHRIDRRTARSKYRAAVHSAELRHLMGEDQVLETDNGAALLAQLREVQCRLEEERDRDATRAVAAECGFRLEVLEAGGLRAHVVGVADAGAWLEADTGEGLREMMRDAAARARALQILSESAEVEALDLPEASPEDVQEVPTEEVEVGPPCAACTHGEWAHDSLRRHPDGARGRCMGDYGDCECEHFRPVETSHTSRRARLTLAVVEGRA